MAAPKQFGSEFLEWLREHTERAWRDATVRTLDDWNALGVGGFDWQPGTKWRGGLDDAAIEAIEAREETLFPPDFRLFLQRLHATDRPRVGALFGPANQLVPKQRPGFYDWQRDLQAIGAARVNVFGGLLFDVEHNGLWRDEWGSRPADEAGRMQVLGDAMADAPKLLPLFEHRFLVAEPNRPGNPVLSIHQSDIIVYGSDLRTYLLAELGPEIGEPAGDATSSWDPREIPFWGSFIG